MSDETEADRAKPRCVTCYVEHGAGPRDGQKILTLECDLSQLDSAQVQEVSAQIVSAFNEIITKHESE